MSEYSNYENIEERRARDQGCPTTSYQHVSVSVPVAVIPYAKVGRIQIHCNGNTAISSNEAYCNGNKDGICRFVITQSFCVEIPVNLGASVNIGDTFVESLGAASADGNNENDNNCDDILL